MVGAAIKKSGIDRSSLFITTKLWNHQHAAADVEPALDQSLKDLGTDYVDLYLMHWPSAFKSGSEKFPKDKDGKTLTSTTSYVETWKAMEKLTKSGKARAIGVSNFSKKEMETLLKEATITPAAHQMECHPWLQQKEFCEWHKSKGIHVQHYSPFGNQNEIYDSGKNMGKLMVRPCSSSPNTSIQYSNLLMQHRMTPSSSKSARSTTRPAHKSLLPGALRAATPCFLNPRHLRESSRILTVTLSLMRKI